MFFQSSVTANRIMEMVCLTIPLFWTLCIWSVSAEDPVNITAEPGQRVILPCRSAGSSAVIAVQWRRTDLGSGYVLLYRDGRFDLRNQNPSYRNRVDLLDRQMKNGNVSLVLKNVTTDDTGLYQCQVQNEDTELIRTINLQVYLPPENKDGGTNDGSIGLIVGLIIFAVVIAVVVISFLIYKKQPACLRKKTSDDPVNL